MKLLEGVVVDEINRLPCVLMLSFHRGEAVQLETALLDIGNDKAPQLCPPTHTVYFLLDPRTDACFDFRPLDWVLRWNTLQKEGGADSWRRFWYPLLSYAKERIYDTKPQSRGCSPSLPRIPDVCTFSLEKVMVDPKGARVRVNYEHPTSSIFNPKIDSLGPWWRQIYTGWNCTVIIDEDQEEEERPPGLSCSGDDETF